MTPTDRAEQTFDAWIQWMTARHVRPRARETYAREVRLFTAWIGDAPTLGDVTADALERYHLELTHLAASTIRKKFSAIRSWCRWCQRAKLRTDDPTTDLIWPERRKRLPRALKAHELRVLDAILAAEPPPDLSPKALWRWRRNQLILLLLVYGGFRRAEVAGLRWADIDLDAGTAIVREESAKGGNERVVPLHPRVIRALDRIPLKARRGAVAGHQDGRCLSHQGVGHIFERWLVNQGLRISAHRLRHTCATEMLRHGASIRDVQKVLGHADIRTTEGYIDLLVEQQRAAVERLPDRFV